MDVGCFCPFYKCGERGEVIAENHGDGCMYTEKAMNLGDSQRLRLDSWKSIAGRLGRSVRTVQRWESEEGLPVHRLHLQQRGSVFAYQDELDAWWDSRSQRLSAEPAEPEAVKNIPVADAAKLLSERKDVVVIDLRTDAEFKDGHIAGAKNIDFRGADFAQKIGVLDKGKTYLIHCASGGRSTRSLEAFQSQKFTSILHLNEGFKAWTAAGQPVEK